MNTGKPYNKIDIRENYLLKNDDLLEILLQDKTTAKNMLWATDSYEQKGKQYAPLAPITSDLITGQNGSLIQPRAVKSKEEQLLRTRDKAEVFTPLSIVKQMNDSCDTMRITKNNWQDYVGLLKLEITCGKAPGQKWRFNVPTATNGKGTVCSLRVRIYSIRLSIITMINLKKHQA